MRTIKGCVLIIISLLYFLITSVEAAEPIQPWSSTNSLPYIIASHVAFNHNGFLYILGGSAVTGQSKYKVLSSQAQSNGTLSNWQINPIETPTALIHHTQTMKGNTVYILGGKEENPGSPNSSVNKVWMGKISPFGTIGLWEQQISLPKAFYLGSSTVIGNRIYYMGGFSGSVVNKDIFMASINPDGTLGGWSVAGQLPTALFAHGMIEHNGHIIIVGGNTSETILSNKVYTTTPAADGTISSWQQTTSLPSNASRAGVVKVGQQIFVVGGQPSPVAGYSKKVYYADLNSDGTVGPWQQSSNSLPQGICCAATTTSNNFIYVTGGYSTNYLNTVYYTKVNVTPEPLEVPYFNQNDLPWGPTEYDHTKSLGQLNETMDRWGCAVTSAAMVLRFHNMEKFPNETSIDPGSLNQWLKNNSGYIKGKGPNGWYSYINWNKIATLTKELFDAGKATKKLTHERAYPSASTTTVLNNDLAQFPDILQVKNSSTDGHFVVVKGLENNVYQINDPEWNYPTLSSFNNSYSQVDRYIPSLTNFGYIMVIVNPEVEILVTDENGNKTGKDYNGDSYSEIIRATYASEDPISNPDFNDIIENLGTGVNSFLLNKPEDGEYSIELSAPSPTPYYLHLITFDKDGNMTDTVFIGMTGQTSGNTYSINYFQSQISTIDRAVSFESVIEDVDAAYSLGFIIHKGLYQSISMMLKNAKKDFENGKVVPAKIKLDNVKRFLTQERAEGVSEEAYQTIMRDVDVLLSQL